MALFKINICNKEPSQKYLVLWLRGMVLHLPFTLFYLQHQPSPNTNGRTSHHTTLKFRGIPSKLTGPKQVSRGVSLVFYKKRRQDTPACKKGVTVLYTKGYYVPLG